MDVSVAEWLAWLTSNCGRIGAIGSSPSNGLRPNMWGQKGFNPLCQCVYIYVCIVKPDIQTIHRCSHTSIHTYMHAYILWWHALLNQCDSDIITWAYPARAATPAMLARLVKHAWMLFCGILSDLLSLWLFIAHLPATDVILWCIVWSVITLVMFITHLPATDVILWYIVWSAITLVVYNPPASHWCYFVVYCLICYHSGYVYNPPASHWCYFVVYCLICYHSGCL